MSKAFDEAQKLHTKYGIDGWHSSDDLGRAKNRVDRAGIALVILATFSHTTRLKDGAVEVRFVESFNTKVEKETTAEELLQVLTGQLVSLPTSMGKKFGSTRGISGSDGFSLKEAGIEEILQGFIDDPIAAVPPELQESVCKGLEKKAKSINKRVRNYDSEVTRRVKGRKSRAITSLTKMLAELDHEFQELAVRALRHNHTIVGKYGVETRTLQEFANSLNTILSGNNLENWQDEDVILEAVRLAGVHTVMSQ